MSLSPQEEQRLEALVAAYRRLPSVEPSGPIDAAVRANARAALRTQRPRWPALLATAATMTIAVGLAWQLRDAENALEPPGPVEEGDSRPAARDERRGENEAREDAPTGSPAPVAAPGPGAMRDAAPPAKTVTPRSSDDGGGRAARTAPRVQAESKPESGADRSEARRRAPASAPQPFPGIEQASRASGAPPLRELREAAPAESPPSAPSVPPPPPPAAVSTPAAPPAVAKSSAANAREEPAAETLARDAVTTTDAYDDAYEMPPQPDTDARLGAATGERTPQDWLDEIVRLLRTGQRERAVESLREFRAVHPDAELPPELAELLP